MPFEHVVTVRFQEVDRAGIAFFGRVFEYCHVAYEELFRAAGVELQSVFDRGAWGMPLAHAEADYSHPMRMGERLRVEASVDRAGDRSLAFVFQVVGADDGVLRATVRHVHVFVDMETFTSIPIPAEVREALRGIGLLAP